MIKIQNKTKEAHELQDYTNFRRGESLIFKRNYGKPETQGM
jgi:hypothetical protein